MQIRFANMFNFGLVDAVEGRRMHPFWQEQALRNCRAVSPAADYSSVGTTAKCPPSGFLCGIVVLGLFTCDSEAPQLV